MALDQIVALLSVNKCMKFHLIRLNCKEVMVNVTISDDPRANNNLVTQETTVSDNILRFSSLK